MNSLGILHVALPFHQVAQPGDALVVGGRSLAALLVLPVGGDALFGDAVHLFGPDLHFEGLALRSDHGGVERLVEVGPRDGDEVLDAAGNGPPLVVDHAQRGVAVLHRVGDDAQGHQVVDLVDGDLLPPQLLKHGVGPLHAAVDAGGNALAPELGFHGLADLVEELLVGVAARLDGGQDLFVGVGLEVLEGEVFQLAADLAHAEAVGDGRVDLDGFAGDAFAALGTEVARGSACCACGRRA